MHWASHIDTPAATPRNTTVMTRPERLLSPAGTRPVAGARLLAYPLQCRFGHLLSPYPFQPEAAMKKLKLNIDDLEVAAFETAAAPEKRGTVEGRQQYTYFCDTVDCTGENGTSCNWSQCYTCYTCPPVSPNPAECA
jgi:hypothetical protein